MKIIFLNIGTNDISYKDRNAKDVAEEIVYVCQRLYERKRSASILLTGILPGKGRPLWKVVSVNNCLNTVTIGNNYNMHYIPPTIKEWVGLKERDKSDLYASDQIHLSYEEYKVLAYHIQRISLKSRDPLYPPFSLPPRTYPTHDEDAIERLERIV